jgi:hypothetical protein
MIQSCSEYVSFNTFMTAFILERNGFPDFAQTIYRSTPRQKNAVLTHMHVFVQVGAAGK